MKSVLRSPSLAHRRARAAFTLVELLTVIAVIAILAAIIFPALGSAQKKARQSTSINNLHSWYTGFSNAMADNNGDMPTPGNNAANAGDTQSWINAMPKGLGLPTYADFVGNSRISPGYGTKSVWVNPAVPSKDLPQGGFTFFYGYNDRLVTNSSSGGATQTTPMKYSQLDNPRLTVLMGEKVDLSPSLNFQNVRAYFNTSDPKADPDGIADFLFCDGHMDSVKRSVFTGSLTLDSNAFINRLTTISWLPFQQQ